MGDQIAEPLDIGHIGGRHGQHQGDAIGDVQVGGLAGVLHGANHVAGVALGLQVGGQHGIEDHETAGGQSGRHGSVDLGGVLLLHAVD